jgi:hypothetical protein
MPLRARDFTIASINTPPKLKFTNICSGGQPYFSC